jgi:hypothetical protein
MEIEIYQGTLNIFRDMLCTPYVFVYDDGWKETIQKKTLNGGSNAFKGSERSTASTRNELKQSACT